MDMMMRKKKLIRKKKLYLSVFALAYNTFVFSHKSIAFHEKFHIVEKEIKYIFLPAHLFQSPNFSRQRKIVQNNAKICE